MEFGNFGVMHIFFLVPQELVRYIVQPITCKLMLAMHVHQQIKLNTAICIHLESFSHSHHF